MDGCESLGQDLVNFWDGLRCVGHSLWPMRTRQDCAHFALLVTNTESEVGNGTLPSSAGEPWWSIQLLQLHCSLCKLGGLSGNEMKCGPLSKTREQGVCMLGLTVCWPEWNIYGEMYSLNVRAYSMTARYVCGHWWIPVLYLEIFSREGRMPSMPLKCTPASCLPWQFGKLLGQVADMNGGPPWPGEHKAQLRI